MRYLFGLFLLLSSCSFSTCNIDLKADILKKNCEFIGKQYKNSKIQFVKDPSGWICNIMLKDKLKASGHYFVIYFENELGPISKFIYTSKNE